MKTGRRRKKKTTPEERPAPSPPSAQTPSPLPSQVSRAPSRSKIVPLVLVATVAALAIGAIVCSRACSLFGERPAAYLPATAEGSWTTTVNVMAPQTVVKEGWRSDCEAEAGCTVLAHTCQLRQREDRYTEQKIDDYDEYAYNIYYEETEGETYEAAGGEFAITQLNQGEDWIEGNRHYVSEEWLDEETCQYTQYTVWITDPDDSDSEIEVVLSECEVWDHVLVYELVYEEEDYCQIETVDSLAIQDTLTRQGDGTDVAWPEAAAPSEGELEREFEGRVVFTADGTEHMVTVSDESEYVRYLTVPHYLAVDEDGKVVGVTDKAP